MKWWVLAVCGPLVSAALATTTPSPRPRPGACTTDADCTTGSTCVGVQTTRGLLNDTAKRCLSTLDAPICADQTPGHCPSFSLTWGDDYREIATVCTYIRPPNPRICDSSSDLDPCVYIPEPGYINAFPSINLSVIYGCVDYQREKLLYSRDASDLQHLSMDFAPIVRTSCVDPSNPFFVCSGQGTCAPTTARSMNYSCLCNVGFVGSYCETIINNNCTHEGMCGGGACDPLTLQCVNCSFGMRGDKCAECDPTSKLYDLCGGWAGNCVRVTTNRLSTLGLLMATLPNVSKTSATPMPPSTMHQCACVDGMADTTCDTIIGPIALLELDSNDNAIVAAGFIGGAVVIVGGIICITAKCRRNRHTAEKSDDSVDSVPSPTAPGYSAMPSATPPATQKTRRNQQAKRPTSSASNAVPSSPSSAQWTTRHSDLAMWEDPVLLSVRVPYKSVFFGPLLSRGGYGEVYKGMYQGKTIAIKQLLPERRKDMAQLDAFLSEVKLMMTLEHDRIVTFLGVAWHALSDACVLIEYMERGDLRSVLTQWDTVEHRPQGFDTDKVKIAVHVAHGLTYLHALTPVIVHRDLKSNNILLNATWDAKLSDFGIARERADLTMTGGVGTSLWMAPEVMLGERYDEKADIFSFGVVLSELDTQKLPYAHAMADRRLPYSAILQMVSLGRLQVGFSETAHPELVRLGRDCVLLDARKRPSSVEVLHRVHQVLLNDF